MTRQSTRMRVILHASMAQGIDMTTDKQIDTPFEQEKPVDALETDIGQTDKTPEEEPQITATENVTTTADLDSSVEAALQEEQVEDAPVEEEQAQQAFTMNIGQALREKRLALGFDEKQVAAELKLTQDQVKAMEENNFSFFRSITFTRGFLKSYSRLLELDAKDVLSAFDEQQQVSKPSIEPVDTVVHKQSHLGDPIVIFVSVVIVAVLVFFVFWWPSQSSDDAATSDAAAAQVESPDVIQSASPEPEPEVVATESAEPIEATDGQESTIVDDAPTPAQESQSLSDDQVVTGLSPETVALLEEAGVSPEDVVKASQEPVKEVEDTPAQPFYLDDVQITFSEDCWTEIRDSTGKILFSGVKAAGSELNLSGEAPYRVVFGYSRGVSSLKYKGQEFDFSSYVRKDLARFELK